MAPGAWLDSGTCSLASVLVTSGLVVSVSHPPFHVLALAGWRSVHRCRFGSLSVRAVALGLGLACLLLLVYGWYQNGEVCTVDGSLPLRSAPRLVTGPYFHEPLVCCSHMLVVVWVLAFSAHSASFWGTPSVGVPGRVAVHRHCPHVN